MSNFRFALFFAVLFSFQNCGKKTPLAAGPLNAEFLPPNVQAAVGNINQVNSWVEDGKFFVTGICSNTSPVWQKIWLEAVPHDAAGKPVAIANHGSAIVRTFSDAVPPSGQTTFFAFWPLSDFSKPPVSCQINMAGTITPKAGPILVITNSNGMRLFAPATASQPAPGEVGWQMSGTIQNPLQMVAARPRVEVLFFGKDNLLWYATLLDPLDAAAKQVFHFDKEGPFQPGEERGFSLQVSYENLPQALKDKKIRNVQILPFEAR